MRRRLRLVQAVAPRRGLRPPSGSVMTYSCCVTHLGQTHGEHMRELELRMARERCHRVVDGVALTVAKVREGEPVTRHEVFAVQQAVLAVYTIRRDLAIALDDIARYEAAVCDPTQETP